MRTETVTKTVRLPLATSRRKNERVRTVIDEWQRIAGRMAELMPSFGPQHWRAQDSTLFRAVQNEFPEHGLRAHDAYQAAYKVGEAFGSWHSNGRRGRRPTFGEGDFARLCHCAFDIVESDGAYGVKVGLQPYKSEWFRILGGEYQTEYLERICAGGLTTGSGELYLDEDGGLRLHLSVSEDIEVCEWGELAHTVGVDLGERVMWAAAVASGNSIHQAELESGLEYRHHRERLKRKRERFMGRGELKHVKAARNQYYNYTDHITHTAARRIVSLAEQYDRCGIVLEDLRHYRERDGDAIHDWPYAELQTKVCYKATELGIPVKFADPAGTSRACRKCGDTSAANRSGADFKCLGCGYEVHADLNAAMNLALENRTQEAQGQPAIPA